MTTCIWRGDAPAVAQVDTLTVGGTIEATDIFIMTINGKTLSVVAGSTVAATVAATIVAAWNLSTIPEFAEITAAVTSGGAFTLTADTAGKPFVCTVSTTETGGGAADAQTFGTSATTASSGPNHWDTARNWSNNAVPVNGDDVYFQNNDVSALYGLAQSAVTLASLYVDQSFTGAIGLPRMNEDGDEYYEYRETYLEIGATILTIGRGEGAGSGRIKINNGSVQTALTVYNSGSPLENGLEAILWKGTSASNVVVVSKGSVGVAVLASETANVSGGFTVGYQTNQQSDAAVRCGSGVTFNAITQTGGSLTVESNVTTLNKKPDSGEYTQLSGTLGTLNGDGGTVYYRSNGTLTTLNAGKDFTFDTSRDPRSRTVTNCDLQAGTTIHDPSETVTWTNGWVFPAGVGLQDVTIRCGDGFTLTKS